MRKLYYIPILFLLLIFGSFIIFNSTLAKYENAYKVFITY